MRIKKHKSMKRGILLIIINLLFIDFIYSQNVGINSTGAVGDPSAMLDVVATNKGVLAPRLALTGPTDAVTIPSPANGLFVYNTGSAGGLTPGFYFNRGTSASPFWMPFDKTVVYHASSTSNITIAANGAVTLIPGTAISFNVPAGLTADVEIYAYSGMSFAAGWLSTDNAYGDLILYKNNAQALLGAGWNRIKLTNTGTNSSSGADMNTTSIIARDVNLAAGAYTYDLRGNRYSGSWSITVGGNCATQVNCAQLKLVVTYR